MKKYYVKKEEGIIGGEYRQGWRVVEKIGLAFGKKAGAEEYPHEGLYRTRKEALENCPIE